MADFFSEIKKEAKIHTNRLGRAIGRDLRIELRLVFGMYTQYEHICLVLPTSLTGTTQLARREISGGHPVKRTGSLALLRG